MLPKFSLILGGAASGKSKFAEARVLASGLDPLYIATAQAYDAEMKEKIHVHQQRRGTGWTSVEAPLDVNAPLRAVSPHQACLLDCATLWLSNHLQSQHDISLQTDRLVEALAAARGPVVVVSNEVGQGIVPDNALARRFREEQGRLNIALAEAADAVVFVTAGLPQVLKGVPF